MIRVWKTFEYLLIDLDYIFRLYLILEVYISLRRTYLIQILIYTGFEFLFFLNPVSFEVGFFFNLIHLCFFVVFCCILVKRLRSFLEYLLSEVCIFLTHSFIFHPNTDMYVCMYICIVFLGGCQDHDYKRGSFSLCVCNVFIMVHFVKKKVFNWITELTAGSFSCQRKKKEKWHSHRLG